MFNRIHAIKKLKGLLHASGVIVCLLLYCIGSIEIESLHGISHETDRTELHSVEAESDPCHISLYHQERAGACDHETHVSQEIKCSICDSVVQNAHLRVGVDIERFQVLLSNYNSDSVQDFAFETLPYLHGRAPPVI